ncbi:MAG: DUF2202 domain-containing protein [Chloroflexota bacterium]
MLKSLKTILAGILAAILLVAIVASAYSAYAAKSSSTALTTQNGQGNGQGNGNGTGTGTGTSVLDIPASDLSAEETAALLYMREEEKLARDVYNFLYTTWGQPTFQNIAASEQAHMDEIKVLLDRYGLADPALDAGQFTDANLQALYTQLTTQGALSLGDALKVGAAIEEIDILDLQTRLAQTDNADLQQVFTNLMNGSYNHLKSFTSVLLTQTGETYQPQYLTAEQYQSIITSTTTGNGNGNGGQGAGGQGQGQGNGGQGNGGQGQGQGAGTGIPQASITGATTVHGTVVSYDLTGMSITLDDGTALYVQLGNSRYNQSIGFAPQIGEGVTIYGFTGDQSLFSAITVTLDSTGQVYTFRTETGQPLWAGGNGKGNGNGGNH